MEALAFCHSWDVIHADVCDGNMLLRPAEADRGLVAPHGQEGPGGWVDRADLVMIDFGLSSGPAAKGETSIMWYWSDIRGRVSHMPPEMG